MSQCNDSGSSLDGINGTNESGRSSGETYPLSYSSESPRNHLSRQEYNSRVKSMKEDEIAQDEDAIYKPYRNTYRSTKAGYL